MWAGVLWLAPLAGLTLLCVYEATTSPFLLPAAYIAAALVVGLLAASRSLRTDYAARPSSRQPPLALVLYAGIGAVAVALVRQAMGFDDPPPDWTRTSIPTYFFVNDPNVSVYDKSHVRVALLVWVGSFATLSVTLTLWWNYLRSALRLELRAGVPTALLVMVVILGSVTLPAFWIDLPHWSVWLGPAVDVGRGMWPYLHTPSGYGFMSAGAVALWFHLFPINTLSFAVFMSLATLATVVVVYRQVTLLTRNQWIALACCTVLIFGFYDLARAIAAPNLGAFRWQLPAVAGLLCLWLSLSSRRGVSLVAGILFAAVCLWDPLFLAFLAMAYTGIHLYRFAVSRHSLTLLPLLATLATSAGVFATMILLTRWPTDGIPGIFKRTTETSVVYMEGFAARAQSFGWFELACLGAGLAIVYCTWLRLWQRHRVLRRVDLFLVASLVATLPAITSDLGRTDPEPVSILVWILLPGAVVLLHRYYRFARRRRMNFWPGFVPVLLLVASLGLPDKIAARAADIATHYEKDRFNWSSACAEQVRLGGECELAKLPTLQHALADALQSPLRLDDQSNTVMIGACQARQAILSELDAFVYALGECDSADRPASIVNTFVTPEVQQVLESAMQAQEVVIDRQPRSLPHWNGFAEYAEEQLRERGFVAIEVASGSAVQSFLNPRALSNATELLTNGSFQSTSGGQPSDWSVIGNPIVGQIDSEVLIRSGDSMTQSILAIPTTRYLYTVQVRSDQAGSTGRLQMTWADAGGELIGASISVVDATSELEEHQMLGTAPPGAVSGTITLVAQTGSVWFSKPSVRALVRGEHAR